ncbi:OsmC family peroxiredoxin [Pseudonocardia spinosispora]|uniref:OsmC family peroxiredoxin n=1 Tax=Pseudonocardia spinosispora TaxID=103441 RepID=UPI0004244E51|nr:OsmC family peroxiredoxin [Pseudonocardia spinosispora]
MLALRRTSSASWSGPASSGQGSITVGAGVVELPFSLKTRIGEQPASNPEELLGAAHAGCFAMSLANECENNGTPAQSLATSATVHLVETDDGFRIPTVRLRVRGRVAGVDAEQFNALAVRAEANCPVSRLFNAEVTVEALLEQS